MPHALPSPCLSPGCATLSNTPRCTAHTETQTKATDPLYSSARWQKVRGRYRAIHPLCERCESEGRTVAGQMVHHIVHVGDGGPRFDMGNLETLCNHCHAQEHAA